MPLAAENEPGRNALLGMPDNMNIPGRRSKAGSALKGDGSIGDVAFRDGILIVLGAWVLLFLLAYTLRHHNV